MNLIKIFVFCIAYHPRRRRQHHGSSRRAPKETGAFPC